MFLKGFNNDTTSRFNRIRCAINPNCAMTRFHKEHFTHISMGVGGRNVSRRKASLREIS